MARSRSATAKRHALFHGEFQQLTYRGGDEVRTLLDIAFYRYNRLGLSQ